MIIVTDQAAEKIISNLNKHQKTLGIRVGVKTTGCSGLEYVLEYADKFIDGDISVVQPGGFSVIINKRDETYLRGVQLDYVSSGLNEGFEFNNPNERGRCGCGKSFRI